jgi:prepilin-type N-terminal cleavage/methylation domain-containing protein
MLMYCTKNGFTLTELLIVIAIISILTVIAIPAYIGQQKNAARTEAFSNLENLRLLEEQYYAENACYYMTGGPPAVPTNVANLTGVANIQTFLPGFKPTDIITDPTEERLNFSYSITTNSNGPGGGVASCFIATATGKAGRRVPGEIFTIDCNNGRNF